MRHPFEYSVLRAVPRVDRGEFVNVGVVIYCQERDFLAARSHVDAERLRSLDPDIDVPALKGALAAIEATCAGDSSAGPAAQEPAGARFRFLAAPRSTVVQPGPVHGGLTEEPAAELERLFAQLVP